MEYELIDKINLIINVGNTDINAIIINPDVFEEHFKCSGFINYHAPTDKPMRIDFNGIDVYRSSDVLTFEII